MALRGPRPPRAAGVGGPAAALAGLLLAGLLLVGSLAGCAKGTDLAGAGPPGAGPTASPGPNGPPPSSGPGEPADLLVTVSDGPGTPVHTWRLRCGPPGGNHPNPAVACAVLDESGPALTGPPPDRSCPEVYGGPETATITGTRSGRPLDVHLSRTDGCQIGRWETLRPLLAAG